MTITTRDQQCGRCRTLLDVASFSKDKSRPSGLYPYCKACCSDAAKKRRDSNPDGVREKNRKANERYKNTNKDQLAEKRKAAYWADVELSRKKNKKYRGTEADKRRVKSFYVEKKFGISLEQYESKRAELYVSQGAACGSCMTPIDEGKMHLDHCHKTGVIRALLCAGCNQAFGLLREDLDRISRLADYAEKWRVE